MSTVHRRRIAYSQNFLRSGRLVDRLLERAGIGPDDLVVEIGPGLGIITERLARICRQVLAIEKDPALVRRLRRRLADVPNVALFEADVLSCPLPVTGYKVFASIPFNITAALVERLTAEPCAPNDAYLVVQREAAARFLGEPRETLAALLLKPWFDPALVHRFRRTDFDPAPQVEVVMLRLRKRGPPLIPRNDAQLFRDLVVFAFTAWRPTVRDALGSSVDAETLRRIERRSAVHLGRPPSAVRFQEWLELFAALVHEAGEPEHRAIQGAEARLRDQQATLQRVHRTRVAGRLR